jgi:hypothetical protein
MESKTYKSTAGKRVFVEGVGSVPFNKKGLLTTSDERIMKVVDGLRDVEETTVKANKPAKAAPKKEEAATPAAEEAEAQPDAETPKPKAKPKAKAKK